MKTIQLTKEDRKVLMQLYKNSKNSIEKRNSLTLLLCNRRVSERQIAKMLNIAPNDIDFLVTLWGTAPDLEKYKFLHIDFLANI
jgi:hypothetical protein